jgi:hypothetical protein
LVIADPPPGVDVATCLGNSERSELSCIRQGRIYYPWPIEFSLLDRATRQAVWKTQFQGVDIRKWLPHGKGYEVANTLTCPPDLPSGTYIAALAILAEVRRGIAKFCNF